MDKKNQWETRKHPLLNKIYRLFDIITIAQDKNLSGNLSKVIFHENCFPVLCGMAFWKRLSALFLLALYLFSATAMAELMKMPVLVEHYYDHREENKNTGLIAFLAQHYYMEDGTDMDADEDSRLPFKSAAYPATVFFSLTPPLFIEVETTPEGSNNNSFGQHNELFISSQYLAAIWQPPRPC